MPFPRPLAQNEMQTASFKLWTLLPAFISYYNNNHSATYTFEVSKLVNHYTTQGNPNDLQNLAFLAQSQKYGACMRIKLC